VKILVLEPYYGGSHKTFLDGLQSHVSHDFTLLTLPARKWKWRMRLAAPFFAEKIVSMTKKKKLDAIFCSSFVDVATLRSLLPASLNKLRFYTYFHENQFAYPVRKEDERDFHFGLTNLTTVLTSDKVAFNTAYNKDTFLAGVEKILKICPDMKLEGIMEKIETKSSILNPGIDFSHIDATVQKKGIKNTPPIIVWNHRWEHDKNPKLFFKTLFALDDTGIDFRLIILGQSFRRKPSIFLKTQEKLQHKISHCGFVESREEYARLLQTGDIVVSAATHEFYGISVIEAVRAGCYPLLPNRLSYPELFPEQYLYGNGQLYSKLKSLLVNPDKIDKSDAQTLTDRFSWAELEHKYREWFGSSPCVLKHKPGKTI
jgi:glycosyltransferase involved in cell wall biosynthesis